LSWHSLSAIFTSKPDTRAGHQRDLRRLSKRSEIEFLRALSEGRLPDESWRSRGACGPATAHLFFPQQADPEDEKVQERLALGKIIERIELGRPDRLESARAICDGCEVKDECTAFSIRIGLADKHAIYGGMTPNERKQIGTHLRVEMSGGCPIIDEVGWDARRKLFRKLRAEMTKKAEPHPDTATSEAELRCDCA